MYIIYGLVCYWLKNHMMNHKTWLFLGNSPRDYILVFLSENVTQYMVFSFLESKRERKKKKGINIACKQIVNFSICLQRVKYIILFTFSTLKILNYLRKWLEFLTKQQKYSDGNIVVPWKPDALKFAQSGEDDFLFPLSSVSNVAGEQICAAPCEKVK